VPDYLEPASTQFTSAPITTLVCPLVCPSSLLLDHGGDEFAAEVRDVRNHAAPDQVGGDR
jgi:hypothetical protein